MKKWFSKSNAEFNDWLWNWTIGWAIVATLLTMLASPCHAQGVFGRNPFYNESPYSQNSAASWPEYTSGAGFWGWFLAAFKST